MLTRGGNLGMESEARAWAKKYRGVKQRGWGGNRESRDRVRATH